MDTGLVHLHSVLRWILLILLVFSIFKSYSGWKSKKIFTDNDRKTWLFTMITAHVTLLLGLYQWIAGRIGMITTTMPEGTSFMKDKLYRFFWMEHPLLMILSIILITLGYGMSKKSVHDELKYKKAFQYFLIALILILIGIPWPFREIIGRPLFPGM
jgi:hypothetical protein